MPKINVDSAYLNHPKTRRLKIYCGSEADIFPVRLWCFCAEYFPKDGVLKGYTGPEIEGILGYTGTAGNLIYALLQVGFLRKDEAGTFAVHDWCDHAAFIWIYKEAGRRGGINSGKSRTLKPKPPSTLGSTRGSTMELNGIELNIKERKIKKETFTKPTLQEIQDYCRQRRNHVDPVKFFSHYESNGWRVGKNPMRNWHAAISTWERNDPAPGMTKGGRESVHAEDERINAVHDSITEAWPGLEDMPQLSKAVQ